ncbi:MAG: hypothetical protein JXR78_00345 [Victivallales bacterium]|nr:hypothetical protein [Victivallales bacterium]
MSEFRRFNLKTLDDLKAELERLGMYLPLSEDLSVLAEPVKVGSHTLSNRFIVQPMEGVDADPASGNPSELTCRRYRRFAEGGSSMIWAEAVAVVPDGRSNPKQMLITKSNLDAYKRLVDETKQAAMDKYGHEILFVVQLTHSGRFSKPDGIPAPLKAQHNPHLDKALGMETVDVVSDDYLDRIQDDFINCAKLCAEAGFDGVDMKAVHGYLIAELLGAHRRPGKYGGSYENRTRFIKECSMRMMRELPPECFVTSRTTVLEPCPYPYGWGVAANESDTDWNIDLTEPKQLLRELKDMGMPLLNISIGFPRFQPYMNRPHDNSLVGAPPPPEYPLEGVVRFQNIIRDIQMEIPDIPVPTAGLAWLRHLTPYVAAGMIKEKWCTLIGQGRGAFAYPDSVNDILNKGIMDPKKCCTTCSMCSQIMKDGVACGGCVVRDREIYGPELLKGRVVAKAKGLD